MAALTHQEKKGCVAAIGALCRIVALTPIWGYLWYRLFQLTEAQTSDYTVLFVYIGLHTVFVLVESTITVVMAKE